MRRKFQKSPWPSPPGHATYLRVTPGDTFPPGTTLQDGRFVITGVVASGGQAITYDGIDKRDGTRVAIKCFRVRGASSWKEVELAEREARVLSGLTHPALPKVIAHFEEQGALYLVLEYVEGATLEQLRNGHQLEQRDVVDYLTQVADILHYLHGQSPPIVHRDIKPRNLIRRPDGRIVLVDFGSVRDRLRPEGGSTVVGTFGYMAPEQFQGRANPASDTYGAAATALALLTGRDPDQLPHRGLRLDVEAALGTTSRPELKQLLDACLDPNPDTRPASLREALAKYPLQSAERSAGRASQRVRVGGEWVGGESRGEPNQADDYAEVWHAPFETPGYHRERKPHNRRERRKERREQWREERREQRRQRRASRRSGGGREANVDIEGPLSVALGIPEVRRALRIPIVGVLVFVLLMVLRTALWVVLGVILPRVLHLLQRVTGSRLDDTVEQASSVGGTLRDQLTRVAGKVRESRHAVDASDANPASRYRVAPPTPSKLDQVADNVEKGAEEIEAEIEAALRGWDNRSRK